jgi:hypothetical protein
MRQEILNDYFSKVNFKKTDWTVNNIKKDIQILLGEIPAMQLEYRTVEKLNESTNAMEKIENLESIEITFTDDNDKFKTLKYII